MAVASAIHSGGSGFDRARAISADAREPPDRNITLGGTTLELNYVGLNHSDSTLVMRLPREKIVFIVDLLPVARMPGRGMTLRPR
jgi:hypothetical protein